MIALAGVCIVVNMYRLAQSSQDVHSGLLWQQQLPQQCLGHSEVARPARAVLPLNSNIPMTPAPRTTSHRTQLVSPGPGCERRSPGVHGTLGSGLAAWACKRCSRRGPWYTVSTRQSTQEGLRTARVPVQRAQNAARRERGTLQEGTWHAGHATFNFRLAQLAVL